MGDCGCDFVLASERSRFHDAMLDPSNDIVDKIASVSETMALGAI